METAEYAPQVQRARIQADAVRYARAVREQEWPAMSDGHGSPAPSVWSTDFRLPRKNNLGRLTTLTVITALLTTMLIIIRDVGRPFGGIINVEPTAITEVERRATRGFLAHNPATGLPCDDRGTRLARPPPTECGDHWRRAPVVCSPEPMSLLVTRRHVDYVRVTTMACSR
ncbi:hypothetical protein [Streptomyces sp. NPDC002463]|uniref:hypothetical protein n=1 Tax=Streptomyces sp. NPDC002463 TaxID=3364645 RepID=UPI00369ADC0B